MRAKNKVLRTGFFVFVLVALLAPAARWMDLNRETANDAEHMVEPMLRLVQEGPVVRAQIPVEPVADIEEIWAIEDTREEAEEPLIAGMRNGEEVLGYDSESGTYYCTLGMETGDEWPELELFAAGNEEGLRIVWYDDYTYDYPGDSIRDGWRYELMAYTDTHYQYIGMVFTGLPLVTIHVEEGTDIGEEYVPARAGIAAAGYEPLNAGAWVHTRGGGYDHGIDKLSYRLEFHGIADNGRDEKTQVSPLGMPADTDWLLIANCVDVTTLCNHLCWELWQDMHAQRPMPGMLESRMVELFVGDQYMGVYQLMQRYRVEDEIIRMGGNPQESYVYRVIAETNIEKRPAVRIGDNTFELRHAPQGVTGSRAFEKVKVYTALGQIGQTITDEEFTELVLKYVDIDALMSYYVFAQIVDFNSDNINNNMFIWAIGKDGQTRMVLSPWDMDSGLPVGDPQEDPRLMELNLLMYMPRHILDLNLGNSREIMWGYWNEMRQTLMTEERIYEWLESWEDYMNASGAYLRDTEKWRGGAQELNLGEIAANLVASLSAMEPVLEYMWPLDAQ